MLLQTRRYRQSAPSGGHDVGDVFASERPRLLGMAYRMLGVVADAEDVVQESWIRWQAIDPAELDHPAAWLTAVTARLCLDQLRARGRRHEDYVGPWLPEPLVSTQEPGPEEAAELADSLTLGFLILLDQLAPTERAVFILADVFDVPYAEIAATVNRSTVACRQIASRARRKIRAGRPRPPSPASRQLVTELVAASPQVTSTGYSPTSPPKPCASPTVEQAAQQRAAPSLERHESPSSSSIWLSASPAACP